MDIQDEQIIKNEEQFQETPKLLQFPENNDSLDSFGETKIEVVQDTTDVEVNSPKVLKPRHHKAKILIWSDLCLNDIDRINGAIDVEQIKRVLADIFSLEDYESDRRTAILLDLYFYAIQYTRKQKFTAEQTSVFFSIVKKTHEVCVETPFGNMDHCFSYFRDLVLCHAVKRPPFSIELFSPEEVQGVTEYVINTYFRHFKMYKYAFTPLVRLDLSMQYIGRPETPTVIEVTDEQEQNSEAEKLEGDDSTEKELVNEKETEHDKAVSELRNMIKSLMSEELKKLRVSVDEKLKQSEETINDRLALVEGGPTGKSRKQSAKKKK